MPDEALITQIENLIFEIVKLGGENERTSIVPGILVADANPTDLPAGYIKIVDLRDGNHVPCLTIAGMVVNDNDLVNVLFTKGTEPIALSQSANSPSTTLKVSEIWDSGFSAAAFSADANGNVNGVGHVSGDAWGFVAKNTSGAAAAANDVGYIDESGEYKTTTTAQADVAWCVVLVGGANNADIYIARRGRVTVAYTGSAPAAGDYLVTSTTAGDAQAQTTMRPEIFAICLAAGAGGTVEALLLTERATIPIAGSDNILFVAGGDESDFVSTIAAAGVVGDKVYYNAPSSGNINAITPDSTAELGKIILHNTTQVEEAFIIDTGTDATGNFIQVSAAADIAAWVATDAITTRSQTDTSTVGTARFFDIELTSSEIPTLTTEITINGIFRDTGATAERLFTHPFEASVASKRQSTLTISTSLGTFLPHIQPLLQKRFVVLWTASGSGTARPTIRIMDAVIARP